MSNTEKTFEDQLNKIVNRYINMSEEELKKHTEEHYLNIAIFTKQYIVVRISKKKDKLRWVS